MERLILKIKQGEQLSIEAKITEGGRPLDLSNAIIEVEVKEAPYVDVEPLFKKTITTTSDQAVDGQITDPLNGVFQIRLNEPDTSFPVGNYSLVMFYNDGVNKDIISSRCCNSGEYIICEQ